MLTTQALVGAADRVVAVTPLWPNLVEIPKIFGADVECVELQFGRDGWTLDLDRLLAALTPGTRAVYINSPNNPTGWTLDADGSAPSSPIAAGTASGSSPTTPTSVSTSMAAAAGTWRLRFSISPKPDDRVVSTNTFSKSWLMTGWRLGWIAAPRELVPDLATLSNTTRRALRRLSSAPASSR